MAADFKTCCVDGCNGDAGQKSGGRRGFCIRHYWHWKQNRDGPCCSVEGCEGRVYAKSFCNSHWRKWRRSGNPLGVRAPNGEPLRFFLEDVLPYSGSDCLIWPYARDDAGYARLYDGARMKAAHRMVCEQIYGAPPSRKHHAAHSCGKGHEGCVSPKHVRWATVTENMRDRVEHGTSNRGQRQWQARLTEEDIREIRSLVSGMTQSAMARKFGVDQSHISDIINRRRWGWLE